MRYLPYVYPTEQEKYAKDWLQYNHSPQPDKYVSYSMSHIT